MKILITLFAALLGLIGCAVPLLLLTDAQTAPRQNNAIVEAVSDDDCDNPCWFGIEVDVTDREMLETILRDNEIEFGSIGRGIVSIPLEAGQLPFMQPLRADVVDFFLSREDVVGRIEISMDVCLSSVVEAYGEPEEFVLGYPTSHFILYPEEGLIFIYETTTQRITHVNLLPVGFTTDDVVLPLPDPWENFPDPIDPNCVDGLNG